MQFIYVECCLIGYLHISSPKGPMSRSHQSYICQHMKWSKELSCHISHITME